MSVSDDFRQILKESGYCPECASANTSRLQLVDNPDFEYHTCWDCDYVFVIEK